jgi:uncharacterized C2H2 Zn-finger protein
VIQPCQVKLFNLPKPDGLISTKSEDQEVFINCIYCGGTFDGKFGILQHVNQAHKAINTFKCNLCMVYFLKKAHLDKHLAEVHRDEVTQKCIYCSHEVFRYLRNLHEHVRTMHSDKVVQCKWHRGCLKYFHTLGEKEEHVRNVHTNKVHKCIYCNKTFILRGSQRKHVMIEHKNNFIQCKYNSKCGEFFHSQKEKAEHIKQVHEKADNKKCHICHKMFSGLTQHIRAKHKEKLIFNCSFQKCSRIFLSTQNLQSHVEQKHIKTKSRVKCTFCSKLISRSCLLRHCKEVHCAYKCSFRKCSQLFLVKTERDKHFQRDHSKIKKPTKCIYCNNVYRNDSLLNQHICHMHSDVKLKCTRKGCASYFFSQSDCDAHFSEKHLKEEENKTFKCDKCDFTCAKIRYLNSHFTYTHVTPHVKCLKCRKMFPSKICMLRHLRVSHTELKACQHCSLKVLRMVQHQKQEECRKCQAILPCTKMANTHHKKCINNR